MKEKVLKYIKDYEIFENGDRVLIGVSGGPDSVALMDFLNGIKDKFELKLVVCHLNHMLRGTEADEDEMFVKNLCNELEIEFYSRKSDISKLAHERKTSIEETGRDERYKFLYYIKNKMNLNKIALGHHKNDNVETILMRFLRGTGIKGLRGIAPKRDDGVVRPFLCITKDEILKYCKSKGLKSRLDYTNFETEYHRNKLRLEVIPYMESLNPNFSNNVDHLGKMCGDYYDFIQYHVSSALDLVMDKGEIMITEFNTLHEVLKTEILISLVNQLDSTKSVEYQHIKIIIDKLKDQETTTWSVDLPKGIKMIRQYDRLYPIESDKIDREGAFAYKCFPDKIFVFSKLGLSIQLKLFAMDEKEEYNNTLELTYFDYDKILGSGKQLYIRSRKEGDKIEPLGLLGTKKIKEIFINKKIPANLRWKIPLFCVDNEVIWIVGYHRSRKYIMSKGTKNVLQVSYTYLEEEKNEK